MASGTPILHPPDPGAQPRDHPLPDHRGAPAADTVDNAAATPEKEQPYAALGLKPDEYARIREILGRRPTSGELAMYSVMWSEHCSYKSSKIYLRQFGEKVSDEMKTRLMVGMGQNAGVVDIGEGWAVTFKVESHNHPSYIEPFQGAATGVGGIVRDIISMGARPVAVMDQLRFGAIDHPDTARVVHGVVSGISFYGNCLGLPNIGGETVFDAVYQGNPLVNALAVGVLRHEDLKLANASGAGNQVVLFGARTGGDGIGGASILASDSFDSTRPDQAPRRAGRRPVRREGAHRVLPGALPGRARRGDPGPRRRRHLVRDERAGRQRRQRHARRPREGAAARPLAHPRRDPDEREPGAHDGDRGSREARRLPRSGRRNGMSRPACWARSPAMGASRSSGTASRSWMSTPRRSPSTARSTSGPSPTRPGSTRCATTPRPRSCATWTPTRSAGSSRSSSRARTSPTRRG